MDPDLIKQAREHAKNGNYEESLRLFREAGGAEGAYGEGACLYKLGRVEDARIALRRCLEIDPLFIKADTLLDNLPSPVRHTSPKKSKERRPAQPTNWKKVLLVSMAGTVIVLSIPTINLIRAWRIARNPPKEYRAIVPGYVGGTSSRNTKRAQPSYSKPAFWHPIHQWQGNSIKSTETFHVSSHEWKIAWNTYPGQFGDSNFQIFIYKSSGDLANPPIAANVIGRSNDSTIIRGAGDYYLTFNSMQNYSVTVSERR